ncbi:uncharacterized protein LOC110458871 [Mizuhopecten yessoensis]|uniref:Uncharacterized protein n=1 Tax=Mizuhopecten yessoensis TaxID=6573 RepID=A0A210Q5P2_MIZYE|nr:uncharacterized protein LOC110458871 [Mizuhopecten yessoensis]OWF44041.1 hypothetical protein KP79_PYT21149 [Mizuhopecten yessoensis]
MNSLFVILLLQGLPAICWGLECYVCTAQANNVDKCVKTTIQCRESQDACRTQIMWKQPEFWQPRSERYHYVSKSCDRKDRCEAESASKGLKCMRDWYRDWHCIECCQGDRCNYYTTLGAGTTQISMTLLAVVLAVHFFFRLR